MNAIEQVLVFARMELIFLSQGFENLQYNEFNLFKHCLLIDSKKPRMWNNSNSDCLFWSRIYAVNVNDEEFSIVVLRLLTSLKSISSRWCVIDFTSSDSSRDNYTSVIDINCLRKYVHNFLFSFLQWDTNILNYVCFVVWKQDTKNLVSWNLCCLKLNLFCLSFMYVESF